MFKADNSYNFRPIALKMPYLLENTLFFHYILEFVSLVNYYEHRTELHEDHFPFWWRNGGHLGFSVLRWFLIEMKIVWKKSSAPITFNYPQILYFLCDIDLILRWLNRYISLMQYFAANDLSRAIIQWRRHLFFGSQAKLNSPDI